MSELIRFTTDEVIEDEGSYLSGEICFGDLRESFLSTMFRWSKQDYEVSWTAALNLVLRGEPAALITEFLLPEDSPKLEWWPIYRTKDVVCIQNHLLWFDQLKDPFHPLDPLSHLEQRKTHTEDGQRISEWTMTLELFREAVSSLARKS